MTPQIIFEADPGARIHDFIDKVIEQRPAGKHCYFIFNDRIVYVRPDDNATALYLKWMNVNRENTYGLYAKN